MSYFKGSHKLWSFFLLAFFLVPLANSKTYVLPHVFEQKGRISNTLHAYDAQILITYTGLLDSGGKVDVYLYDQMTGLPVVSATDDDVCNPCSESVGRAGSRKSISVEAEMLAKGGFPVSQNGGTGTLSESDVHAIAVIEVSGDTDRIVVSSEQLYANTGPMDLSIRESPTYRAKAGKTGATKRVFVLPHVLESSGKVSVQDLSFTTRVHAVLASGLRESPTRQSAKIDLYLYENTGMPMRTDEGVDVCNPCSQDLTESNRTYSVEGYDLKKAKGTSSAARTSGFGIIVVSGDCDDVYLDYYVVNSHTSPFDLAVFGFNPVEVVVNSAVVGADVAMPSLAKWFSGSPNPTSSGMNFSLGLAKAANVNLDVFSTDGRKITQVFSGNLQSGAHVLRWNGVDGNGKPLAPGIYFAKLSSAQGLSVSRIVVAR
ncbi:MAG: T9SS type A sorting domain-containing protein [Fibrobacteres bacterium]|nr:T9SS type A sorting domain-containing protein [Fibrobacterota bacterium]